MNYLLLICTVSFFSIHAVFDYDRAVYQGKKGKWDQAAQIFDTVAPTSPEIIYDKGVALHRTKNFAGAQEAFLTAAQHPEVTDELAERAFFNAGNASFAEQRLENARDYYKKALEKNDENTYAQHNLKKVEELLKKQDEEKKKKEQENKKDKQQEKQDKDKKDQQDKNKEKENDEQQNKQDKQQQQQEQNQQDKKDQDGKNSGNQQQKSHGDGQEKNNPEKSEEKGSQQDKQQDKNKDEGNGEQQKKIDEQKKKEQQAGQNAQDKKNAPAQSKQSAAAAKKDPASHDEWLAAMLEKSEKRDAQGNKKMIKAMVQQQMRGNEGQNCW